MPRKTSEEPVVLTDTLSLEDWQAQEPCPECGGRPGEHPVTGIRLRIKLPNGDWCEGHTYNCLKRPQ